MLTHVRIGTGNATVHACYGDSRRPVCGAGQSWRGGIKQVRTTSDPVTCGRCLAAFPNANTKD